VGFQIGNALTWTNVPFVGTVLRLLVYDRILTPAELTQNRAVFASLYQPHVAGVLQNRDYWESAAAYPFTIASRTTAAPNSQAVLHLSVPGGVSSVPVTLSTNLHAQGGDPSVAVFVDGVLNTHWTPTTDNDLETFTLSLDGSPHALQIWGSYQTSPLTNAVPAGTYIQSVPSNVSVVAPTAGGRGILVYGDSIASGFGASVPPTTSWVSLLRQSQMASGGHVILEAWGGRDLGGDWNVAPASPVSIMSLPNTAALLVSELAPYSPRMLWIEMGINDFIHGMTLANYTANMGVMLDTIHALDPTISIVLQGFTVSSHESTPNSDGKLPSDWRTAESSLVTGRSFCVFHDYSGVAPIGDFPDGLHPNDAGNAMIGSQAVIDAGP